VNNNFVDHTPDVVEKEKASEIRSSIENFQEHLKQIEAM